MRKKQIVIAPFNNRKAWEKADYICDGVDDQVEIQAAINIAHRLRRTLKFRKGTYDISGTIILPEED